MFFIREDKGNEIVLKCWCIRVMVLFIMTVGADNFAEKIGLFADWGGNGKI